MLLISLALAADPAGTPLAPTSDPVAASPAVQVAAPAGGQAIVAGSRISVGGSFVTDTGTEPRAVLVDAGMLYVLTQAGELQTWSLAGQPAVVARSQQPSAESFFVAAGQVWVTLREMRAVPVLGLASTTVSFGTGDVQDATPPSPSGGKAIGTTTGTVVRVDNGVAVIDRGRNHGLSVGSELRILGTETVRTPSLDGSGEHLREIERIVATARVRVTEDDRALVDLSRGGRVEVGDRIELREGAYGYPVAPPRLVAVGEVGVVLRPVLGLDTVGVAFINDAWLYYSFEAPWYAQIRLAPLAFGWSADGNPVSVAGVLSAGYDSRYFAVGLGAGWSMLNSEPGTTRYSTTAEDGGFGDTTQFKDVDGAFAIVQEARLGGRDGLSISVRNTFLLVPVTTVTYEYDKTTGEYVYDAEGQPIYDESTRDEFVYGGLAMRVNVPTGDRTDLFANWSFGEAGEIVVEGGLSTWLRGNGDKGSLGLQVAAGYGYVEGNPDDNYVVLSGPMVSVGGRYRF